MRQTRTFLFSYYHDGAWWDLSIQAYDREDALARHKKLPNARYDGELMAVIPARVGWIARLVVAIRNAFCS